MTPMTEADRQERIVLQRQNLLERHEAELELHQAIWADPTVTHYLVEWNYTDRKMPPTLSVRTAHSRSPSDGQIEESVALMTNSLGSLKTKAEKTQTDIVHEIILETLLAHGRCHKNYVIERIKVKVHPTHLHTKALIARGYECGNGIKNIVRGAKKVLSDSLRGLRRSFSVKDGWIEYIGKQTSHRQSSSVGSIEETIRAISERLYCEARWYLHQDEDVPGASFWDSNYDFCPW